MEPPGNAFLGKADRRITADVVYYPSGEVCYILFDKSFLGNLFHRLPSSSKRSAARVCKLWRLIGNESLWSSANFSVFASLAPVHYFNGSLVRPSCVVLD